MFPEYKFTDDGIKKRFVGFYGYSAKQNQATHAELNHTPDIEKRPSC
jgi:hypothetical protein